MLSAGYLSSSGRPSLGLNGFLKTEKVGILKKYEIKKVLY